MTEVTSTLRIPQPPRRRARNPRGEGEQLRRELLANALELLSEASHPDEVSIRAIARRTGVSATSAYRHFVDRDDLVYCAIGLAIEQFNRALAEGIAETTDPFERLAGAGRAYREFAMQHRGRYRMLFSNPMACPETTTATDEELEAGTASFTMLVALIGDCLEAGAPAAHAGTDVDYVAFQLWTWIHGILDLRITHEDINWPEAEAMFDDAQRLLGLTRP